MFLSHFSTQKNIPSLYTHTIKEKMIKPNRRKRYKISQQSSQEIQIEKIKTNKKYNYFQNLKSHARSIYDRKL